jgi:stage V sporulation protein B
MVDLARKVLKNSFFNSSRALISGIGGLVFSVALARLLSPELFGIYALALSVCFFILQLDPGTGYALVRYVSDALGKNDLAAARGYFRFLFKIRFVFGLMASILLFALAKPLAFAVFNKPDLFIPLQILSAFIFFYYFSDFLESCFTAFQNFKYVAMRNLIYEFLKFILAIPFAFLGFFYGVYAGIAVATIITFIVMLSFLLKKYQVIIKGENTKVEGRRVLRFMGFISIGSFSGVFFSYVDMIMLGIFLPAEYAGYYKAAANIVFGIGGLIAISNVLFPVFTQLEGEGMEGAFQKVFKYLSILSFPLAVSLAFFSDQIIKVIYGVEYLPAVSALIILSPLIIFNSVDFFDALFGAKERPEYGIAVTIIALILNVILSYILIFQIGMIGVAIATTVSRLFRIVAISFLSKKFLNLSPDASSIYKPVFASLSMLGFLFSFPSPKTFIAGILILIIALFVYFAVLLLIKGIGKEDFKYAMLVFGVGKI